MTLAHRIAERIRAADEHNRPSPDPEIVTRPVLPDWPRLMGVDLAAAYLGLSATTLRQKGPAPKEYGKRRLYDRHDLDRWADRLGGQPLTAVEQRAEAREVERRFLERRRA